VRKALTQLGVNGVTPGQMAMRFTRVVGVPSAKEHPLPVSVPWIISALLVPFAK
jgi:hypothetical protein